MRAAFETRLVDIWYRQARPPWYLRALIPAYRALHGVHRRRELRLRDDDLESKCIVVVGNLTVGGSGKTPLVIRLCELLQSAGLTPGVVSRGYGREDDKQRLVISSSNPVLVGDEPLLIARRTGAAVMVGPGRGEAARELFQRGVDVVISDDGLQHHRLPRAVEICVIDGERGFGNGYLLPAGPLREDPARLATVRHVVINGGEPGRLPGAAALAGINCARMELQPRKVHSLSGRLNWRLAQFAGCRVSAVAGIANPGRFFALLRHANIDPVEKPFPDHHVFTGADFSGLPRDLPIIMTEKDAVKCKELSLENAWYLSVDAHLPSEWEQKLLGEVLEFIDEH